jgi:hypothetical protein
VVGGLVQDFPEHLRVPVLRDGRADALEHVLEEMSDLAAPGGFGFGTNRLPGASDHPVIMQWEFNAKAQSSKGAKWTRRNFNKADGRRC